MATQDEQRVTIEGQNITLTSLSKVLWPKKNILKSEYIRYVNDIAPYMLPFLNQRALTLLRYPHGAGKESFFQKNCPEYAPDFIKRRHVDDIEYIIGDGTPTLIWLANQLAFEIHIPFQTIDVSGPTEIVIDLDPPSRDEFSLAIEAALIIKDVIDRLQLISFVKTSGNKGLQVYLPLPNGQFTWEDTRTFTTFIADYLTETEPQLFTTERLKKNRNGRLYVDYIQHAEGKTIIAPYAVRGNEEALVATPLYWEEVTVSLRPEQFPLDTIKARIDEKGCPFSSFNSAKKNQPFQKVLNGLKKNKSMV